MTRRRQNHPRISGFTLIELLVVVTIIGLLIALLLPAVQGAREAARQAQCNNNLKQLGLACVNYESQHQCFPPSSYIPSSVTDPGTSRVHHRNWVIAILPFLEQQALYDSFDFSMPINHSANRTPRGTDLPVMKCPSDTGQNTRFISIVSSEGDNWARGNYAANASLAFYASLGDQNYVGCGTDRNLSASRFHRGIMGCNLSMEVSEIHDGTSNTILISEVRVGLVDIDRRGTWALDGPGASSLWGHAWGDDNGPNPCGTLSDDILDAAAIMTKTGAAAAQTACMACCCTTNISGQAGTRSRHQHGVHVAMADGSVHSISNYIEKGDGAKWTASPNLSSTFLCWQRLCASQDGQVVDGKKY